MVSGCVPNCVGESCARTYAVFGHRITGSTATAISLLGMMGSIINACVVWSGNYFRDRFGGRQMVIYTTLLTQCVEPFTYAIMPGVFSLNFCWTIWDSVTGGPFPL